MKSEREPLNFSIIKNKTKMKNLLLVTALMLSVVSYGQWKTLEYTDDFGDPTGKTFQVFQCKGLFSNSATTNSDCGFAVKHDANSPSYSVIIYPYNRNNRESFIEGTFQNVKLKTPSGIKEVSHLQNVKNPIDKAYLALKKKGFPDEVFTRAGKILKFTTSDK